MSWKNFFYLAHREKRGILLLLVFISGIFVGKWILPSAKSQPVNEPVLMEQTVSQGIAPPDTSKSLVDAPVYNSGQQRERQRSDNSEKQKRTYYVKEKEPAVAYETSRFPRTEKFPEGTVIELNEADSAALTRIPGIGRSFAKRIIGYRKILGGYHHIEQLQEVYDMYEELYTQIILYLEVNPAHITPIPVNNASLNQLKHHPYIGFYRAKAIVELRKKRGRLNDIEDLQLLEEFTPEDQTRIAPYLEF